MKFTCRRKALLLFSLSPIILVAGNSGAGVGNDALSPEEACRKKLVQEESGEEAERFQTRCHCVPATDGHHKGKEEDAWTLSCKNGCEACFQDECAFMAIDYRFVTSPGPYFLGQTNCFLSSRNNGDDEFCYHMENFSFHWATINGNMCLHAGFCPGGDEDSPLFRIRCSNLGSQYAVDTCQKSDIAKLEKGHPFHFFAYMFGGTADEEPTVGACRTTGEAPSL